MTSRPLLFCLFCLFALAAPAQQPADSDGDGLSDAMEEALIERFLPRFFVSRDECAGLPAEFAAGETEPRVVAENGTIYVQAFPLPSPEGPRVELHFFHLWSKDCGRLGHPLDVEHVAVLVAAKDAASPAEHWRALYWYAAAHEETVCDVSHGAHASALKAENRGAKIWISRAKHASYLAHSRCKLGCGGDTCKNPQELEITQLVNLGQPGRLLNGTDFAKSARWPLAAKMEPDFTETVIQQIAGASPKKIVAVNESLPPVRATILAGENILGGVGTGKRHTEGALERAFRATGRFLKGDKPNSTAGAATVAPPAAGSATETSPPR